jgi:hypothetical protein
VAPLGDGGQPGESDAQAVTDSLTGPIDWGWEVDVAEMLTQPDSMTSAASSGSGSNERGLMAAP